MRDGRVVDAPIGRFHRPDRVDAVRPDRDATSRSRSSAAPRAGAALDLDEGEADVGQRVAHRRRRRRRGGRRARRRGRRRRRSPAPPTPGRAASADRWIAASSYSPITWLVTTTSAGTSATRRRASSIAAWASSTASAAPSRRRLGVRVPRRPSRRIRHSRCATLAGDNEAKWGRPPPGHHHAPAWRVRPGPTAAGDGGSGIRDRSVSVAPRASRRAPTHTTEQGDTPIAQE